MFTTVNALNGDTFEAIARRHLGDASAASTVAAANPGVSQPLTAGLAVRVPTSTTRAAQVPTGSTDPDEIAVEVDGVRLDTVTGNRLRQTADSVDVFSFTTNTTEQTLAIEPLSFAPVTVYVGGALVFTGVLLDVRPALTANGSAVTFSFYSRIGTLAECTPPVGAFGSLESAGQDLAAIADRLTQPYGIASVFLADSSEAFDRVAIRRSEKILDYLVPLAQQRALIVTNDERGDLVFYTSTEAGAPVAELVHGTPPVLSGGTGGTFNASNYHSHVTGVTPDQIFEAGATHTETNGLLSGVLRPHSYDTKDVTTAQLAASVRGKIGRMVANSVGYTVEVSTWRTPSGQLWQPNTTILFTARELYVPTPYEFLIRSVTFDDDGNRRTARLEIVPPGVFSGNTPARLPWQ